MGGERGKGEMRQNDGKKTDGLSDREKERESEGGRV